jgi:hypothetical protein
LTVRCISCFSYHFCIPVYIPVYFQACKGASPVRSGVDVLPYSFSIAPFAIVAGGTATALKKYRIQNVVAWCFIMIGFGLQTTLHVGSATRNWVGFEIVTGIGLGLLVRKSPGLQLVPHLQRCSSPQLHSRYCPLFPSVTMRWHSRCSFSSDLSFK